MSIFRLVNQTGSDSQQSWANDFIFPNNVAIDLLEASVYNEVDYDLGFDLDSILGIKNGEFYEDIAALIRSKQWIINDGDSNLNHEDSLYLLKYGQSPILKSKLDFSGNSGKAFESHNFMDEAEWTEGESKFVVTPIEGRTLYLKGSKILVSEGCNANDDLYFRVFMDVEVAPGVIQNVQVLENLYTSAEDLMLGADKVFSSNIIGNQDGRGSRALNHIIYEYEEPIILKSALNMRLEIGFANNQAPVKKDQVLRVRLNSTSVVE